MVNNKNKQNISNSSLPMWLVSVQSNLVSLTEEARPVQILRPIFTPQPVVHLRHGIRAIRQKHLPRSHSERTVMWAPVYAMTAIRNRKLHVGCSRSKVARSKASSRYQEFIVNDHDKFIRVINKRGIIVASCSVEFSKALLNLQLWRDTWFIHFWRYNACGDTSIKVVLYAA